MHSHGTMSLRSICSVRADGRDFGILEARPPRRAADKLRFAQLRQFKHVMRHCGGIKENTLIQTITLIFIASLLSGHGVWLLGMRPYLQRHGGIVATGATLWGGWADWQQCRDFARSKHDRRALRWSNVFLVTQIGIAIGIALVICRA